MGCPFFPTANGRTPCSPDSPLTSAGRAGPPGSAAAGCSGWARGAQNGRTCGSLREAEAVAGAGVRRGSAEPGAGSGRERQVRERLGEHGSLSRGASCGASDLSPTGKASVSALPPPLPPASESRAARRGPGVAAGARAPASRGLRSFRRTLSNSRAYTGRATGCSTFTTNRATAAAVFGLVSFEKNGTVQGPHCPGQV